MKLRQKWCAWKNRVGSRIQFGWQRTFGTREQFRAHRGSVSSKKACWIVTEEAEQVPAIFLPPRPKLDPYVVDESARYEIDDTLFATIDFCVSGHLGLKKE